MGLNLNDQVLIQALQLVLYFGALLVFPSTLASFVGSLVQRYTGTQDGALCFALRILVVALVLLLAGGAVYSSLKDLLKMVLVG